MSDVVERRSRGAELAADLLATVAGWVIAVLLLRYLHDEWMPGWALVAALLSGIVLRRSLRSSWATFPGYLRGPLASITVLLGTVVASWATLAREPSSYWLLRWREAVTLGMVAIVLGLALVAVTYSHSRMRREIEGAREREAALREATLHAQLRALQAQINPHFLFNALNALAELAYDDPAVAEQLVADLAHLLRYSLRSSSEARVPLAQEIEAVDRYLRVERTRLGERLRVTRDIAPSALQAQVPGLLLQPLVENAVQHAVAPRPGGGTVHIEIERMQNSIRVRVDDDGPGLPAPIAAAIEAAATAAPGDAQAIARGTGGAGGGVANVLQRLALTYRGAASLRAIALSPGTRIEMRIPT